VAFIRYVLFYSFCSKRPHKDTGNRPGSAQQSYYELDLQRERSTDTMAQKTTFVSNQKLILNNQTGSSKCNGDALKRSFSSIGIFSVIHFDWPTFGWMRDCFGSEMTVLLFIAYTLTLRISKSCRYSLPKHALNVARLFALYCSVVMCSKNQMT